MKNKAWIVVAAVSFAVSVTSLVMMQTQSTAAKNDDLYKELKPLMESLSLIQNSYVDIDKTASKALVEGAIKGMVQTLDPYSQFLDEQAYTDMQVETQGEFGGLGIEISIRNKQLTVVSPIEETPAYRAGIQAGDIITRINGESTDGIQLMDAVHKLRGLKGTKVTITVWREGFKAGKDIEITRAIIKIKSVKVNTLEGKIGYIRLSSFMGSSASEFKKALKNFKKQKMSGLVVDVRNNPGGLLNASAEIAEEFVPNGELIVYTDGRFKNKNIRFISENGNGWDKPLVVLVNGGSASASEILAGAVQDHGLGVIVGTKTFGKGSVQTILPLSSGSALRLTTAKYLTPEGRAIHGKGIEPDVVVEAVMPSRALARVKSEGWLTDFVKSFLEKNPGFNLEQEERKAVEVSEGSWKHLKPKSRENKILESLVTYLEDKLEKGEEEIFERERTALLNLLKEELARKNQGEDAARRAALMADAQVKRALDILKVAELVRERKQ